MTRTGTTVSAEPLHANRAVPLPWAHRRDGVIAAVLLVLLVCCYSANGREIGSFDSRPTALAAREFLLRGTTSLNHVVGATPAYADRWGFILAKDGRYRSIYSPVPSLLAAAVTWPFWRLGAIDITAPLAPALMAKATASLLVAAAVVLGYAVARRWLARRAAALLAVGLGLGTGFWSSASQTLWQTETGAFGLALAVLAFALIDERRRPGVAMALGSGLALAGAARPQVAPALTILLAGCWWRARRADAAAASAIVAAATLALCWTNWRWFGHPMGALPLLEEVNQSVHRSGRTFAVRLEPYLGLLASPSRGLLVFSPIAAVAAAGLPAAWRAGSRSPLPWYAVAFAAQLALYASYSVWWGGHTYGPRYLLDTLPLLVPLAASAMAQPWRWPAKTAAAAALAWSIAVAATGAFCYPHEAWNTDPTEIDRHHARLWSWSDPQFVRCWRRGLSPQNFALLDAAAVRRPRIPGA